MLSLFALALASAEAVPEYPQYRPLSNAEMDAALRECRLQHFSIRYEEDLQTQTVTIRDARVTEEQLRCTYYAQRMTGYLLIWEGGQAERFYEIGSAIERPGHLARARAYFADRTDLGPVPDREPGQSDLDYARSLERYCGPEAQGIFSDEYGGITISSDWVMARDYQESAPVLGCVMNLAALVAVPFGFVANEQVSESEPAD